MAFLGIYTYLWVYCCQPTVTGEIQSPMAIASVQFVDPREPLAVSFCSSFYIPVVSPSLLSRKFYVKSVSNTFLF